MTRIDLVLGLAASLTGGIVTALSATPGDPTSLSGLVVYGPLGIICAWLLIRSYLREKEYDKLLQEKDQAHTVERAEDRKTTAALRDHIDTSIGNLRDDSREQLKVLTQIESHLRHRDR